MLKVVTINGINLVDDGGKGFENTKKNGWAFDAKIKAEKCIYCGALAQDQKTYSALPCPCRE